MPVFTIPEAFARAYRVHGEKCIDHLSLLIAMRDAVAQEVTDDEIRCYLFFASFMFVDADDQDSIIMQYNLFSLPRVPAILLLAVIYSAEYRLASPTRSLEDSFGRVALAETAARAVVTLLWRSRRTNERVALDPMMLPHVLSVYGDGISRDVQRCRRIAERITGR